MVAVALKFKKWRRDPKAFFDWALANGYEHGLEIDRENNDKGYKPSNCRFVTSQVNAMNKRTTKWILFRGKRMKFRDAVKEFAVVDEGVARRRLELGWSVKKALLTPKMH